MTALTEGEQNRLIVANTDLVPKIAADYRGQRGVPFEDLVSEGMVGLVKAARTWSPGPAKFTSYATTGIRWHIENFIARWDRLIPLDIFSEEQQVEMIHDWQTWGSIAYYENWETLPITPEDIADAVQEISAKRELFAAALIGLSKRERNMIEARFMRDPPVSLEQIARDHRVSYKRTTKIIYAALGKMRAKIKRMESNKTLGRTPRDRGLSSKNVIPFERRKRA